MLCVCAEFNLLEHAPHLIRRYHILANASLITNDTILALHDTNTHPEKQVDWAYETAQGWVHQVSS